MCESGESAEKTLVELGLEQISDSTELGGVISGVIDEFADEVRRFGDGEEKLLDYLVGQVMKRTKGKANPQLVKRLIREEIEK